MEGLVIALDLEINCISNCLQRLKWFGWQQCSEWTNKQNNLVLNADSIKQIFHPFRRIFASPEQPHIWEIGLHVHRKSWKKQNNKNIWKFGYNV